MSNKSKNEKGRDRNMSQSSFTTYMQQQAKEKSCFVPYIMAGANGLDRLQAEIDLLTEYGATAIEIGIPFSDPVADGPVIQQAGIQARAHGTTFKTIIQQLQQLNTEVPLILMGYANSFFHYGFQALLEALKETNVKALIIPDLPFEHRDLVIPLLTTADIALITLISLTSPLSRINTLTKAADGFVYAVTVNGVTGKGSDFSEGLDTHLQAVAQISPIPVLAGFGIRSAADVKRFSRICGGVVVGSAIVAALDQSLIEAEQMLQSLGLEKKKGS